MHKVEVVTGEHGDDPLLVAEFPFLPRKGEYLSIDTEGYFKYYNVLEVWHRRKGTRGPFSNCIKVELDD